jgi:SAM-dependent methyltransferase
MGAELNLSTSRENLQRKPAFSFSRAFQRHVRDSVRQYGAPRTLLQVAEALLRLLRELAPARRRASYGDLDYDFDHLVDTTRANVSFRTQLTAALTGHQYFPTEPWLFDEMMQALPIEFNQYTFIDIGSGKGRVLLMAAGYGFRKIVGVEFIPALHRVAAENILKFIHEQRSGVEMQNLCMDARDYLFPVSPLVVYLFNPFPLPVLKSVLRNLRTSSELHPRPIHIVYRYPEFAADLAKEDWLSKVAETEQWIVYTNRP